MTARDDSRRRCRRFIGVVAAALLGPAHGCGLDKGEGRPGEGAPGGPCRVDGSCDSGLMCEADRCVPQRTGSVTLTWNAPTTDSDGLALLDLAGYRVYWGTTSRAYGDSFDVGDVTTYVFSELPSATYYFAVTAYDRDGAESILSEESSATVP